MTEKNSIKDTLKKLEYKHKNVYNNLKADDLKRCDNFCDEYMRFLDDSKTERLCVNSAVALLEANGFVPFESLAAAPKAGKKFYYVHKHKAVMAGIIGTEDIKNGLNLIIAHTDSPRLDLKPRPLYESDGMALMKTHYYGGIKKYQWTSVPMELHGVVVRKDGSKVDIHIGGKENDPVFFLSDLLPHLARKQMSKRASEVISGEDMNVLVGTLPLADDEEAKTVKLNILKILNEDYGIEEEDFYSSELTFVPAFKARYIGFDKTLIGSYGHDDRVCAYTALRALIDAGIPKRTAICAFTDKEEIGSMGVTGIQSAYFRNFVADVGDLYGVAARKILAGSFCLSGDVDGGFDPNYAEAFDLNNSARLNGGIALAKYTGAGGKYDTSDASAETVGKIRKLFNNFNITWQLGELGKVDQGGGGTVAQYMANLDVDTIDCGVAVVAMHSPYEIVAKGDVYMTYLGFKAFFEHFDNR
jgi:aspartyl aminopeptidase